VGELAGEGLRVLVRISFGRSGRKKLLPCGGAFFRYWGLSLVRFLERFHAHNLKGRGFKSRPGSLRIQTRVAPWVATSWRMVRKAPVRVGWVERCGVARRGCGAGGGGFALFRSVSLRKNPEKPWCAGAKLQAVLAGQFRSFRSMRAPKGNTKNARTRSGPSLSRCAEKTGQRMVVPPA